MGDGGRVGGWLDMSYAIGKVVSFSKDQKPKPKRSNQKGARSFEKVVVVKLSPVFMVASLRRSVSEEWLEMESGGKKKRKKRKGEGGGGEESHFLSSYPPPPNVLLFCKN